MVTRAMLKLLEGLNHKVVIRITGITAKSMNIGEWEWTLVDEALDTPRICPIKEYIQRRQATVVA